MSPKTQRIGTTDSDSDADATTVPRDGFEGVVDRLSLDMENPQARTRTRRAIGDAYDYLAKYGSATERELQWSYDPFVGAQESQGRYDSRRAWWSAVGREALLTLPGVAEGPNRQLRFAGVSEGAVGSTVPSEVLDVSDDVHAAHGLNQADWSKPRQREAVRDTWVRLRSIGEMSENDVRAALAEHEGVHNAEGFWPTARDVLADMPGIDVTHEGGSPDPDEIEVETLADVLDGLRETGALDLDLEADRDPGEVVWRGRE